MARCAEEKKADWQTSMRREEERQGVKAGGSGTQPKKIRFRLKVFLTANYLLHKQLRENYLWDRK